MTRLHARALFQSEYGGFIYSYALKSIADMNKTEGAYLNAVYWVSFCNAAKLKVLFMLFAVLSTTYVKSVYMYMYEHHVHV